MSPMPDLKNSTGNEIMRLAEGTTPESELYSILRSVSKLALNEDFRNNVYKGVAEKFDGDYNVLVGDLLKNSNLFGDEESNVQASVRQAIADGQRHPQIYIPYFPDLQKRNKASSAKGPLIFVIWDGKETETDTYPGYFINEKGNLEELDFLVSEEYAKENEVWCLSFNERINSPNIVGKNNINQLEED